MLLLPEDPLLNPLTLEQFAFIRDSLENLRSYFCTDGQEIPIQFIDNQALLVKSMLQLSDQTTRKLVDLYHQQKDTSDQYLTQENIGKIIAMRAAHKDPEALAFVEQPTDDDSKVFTIISHLISYCNSCSSVHNIITSEETAG